MRRAGALIAHFETSAVGKAYAAAFEKGLTERGWSIGRNLIIDYRWNIADPDIARAATAGLLGLAPDVILAHAIAAMNAVHEATRTVPVVFTGVSEPVTRGFVASFSRPGGNVTGFTNTEPSVMGKLVELIRQLAPRTTHITFLFSTVADPVAALYQHSFEAAVKQFGLQSAVIRVQTPADIQALIALLGESQAAPCSFRPTLSCPLSTS